MQILGYIDIAQREGARLLAGGKQHGTKGYFVEPTVFADVTDEMTIAQEEVGAEGAEGAVHADGALHADELL